VHVFHDLKDISSRTGATSVAIGNFDGIHVGHQSLIRGMLEKAKSEKLTPTVLTFFPHPVEVLKPQKKLERLTTTSEKLALLENMGVEQVLVAHFDTALSQVSPSDFFRDYLVEGLKSRSIHVGFNFCFGKDREGNTDTLRMLCENQNIFLKVEEQVNSNGERVSSSVVRKLLAEGEVAHAARFLGRPYSITGQVIKGDQRGRKLGFPTANLRCPQDKALPKNGVYVTQVQWQKEELKAVTNVGVRPTFTGEGAPPLIEVHLLDFNSQIYDEFLTVEFLGRIRDEKKFSGLEELKAQIEKDLSFCHKAFDLL